MAKPASINLLRKKKTSSDVVLEWALTTGRFIIIVVETIALAAFAYRFTLDRQIIDLHDKIKNKQAIIAYYKEDEEKFRALQNKLAIVKGLDVKSKQVTPVINEIVELARGKAVLQNLTVKQEGVQISATTTSIPLMNSFIESLKSYENTLGVSISQIENKPDTGQISLVIDVQLKPKSG